MRCSIDRCKIYRFYYKKSSKSLKQYFYLKFDIEFERFETNI